MPSKKSDFDDAIVIEILINLKNKKFFVVASLKDYNSWMLIAKVFGSDALSLTVSFRV